MQTFLSKLSLDALRHTDAHINEWLEKNNVDAKFIYQVFGCGRHHQHGEEEPLIITSIWY